MEAFATPETGRFTVEVLKEDPPLVVVGFYSDGVTGRGFFEANQARALADRLATAAGDFKKHTDGE